MASIGFLPTIWSRQQITLLQLLVHGSGQSISSRKRCITTPLHNREWHEKYLGCVLHAIICEERMCRSSMTCYGSKSTIYSLYGTEKRQCVKGSSCACTCNAKLAGKNKPEVGETIEVMYVSGGADLGIISHVPPRR